ncbi:unnamed protein product [Parajaminaea phylloscopi]
MPPKPSGTRPGTGSKRPAPKPTSPRKGKKGNSKAPVASQGVSTQTESGRTTRNSSNPVVAPIPDHDQVTIDHKGTKKTKKADVRDRTATHTVPLAQQWVTFKRGIEERFQRLLDLPECRYEQLYPHFTIRARNMTWKWVPCSEEAYNHRNTIMSAPGTYDVHGSITYIPPVIHLPPPSPPPVPPVSLLPPSPSLQPPPLSVSKSKVNLSSSRERVATAWGNTQRIKQRIIEDHPLCPQCSAAKHAQARCHVDELGTHLPITSGFLHAWAEAVFTGDCGTTINQLNPRLYNMLYEGENRPPSPTKDPYTIKRRNAASAAIGAFTPPRSRVLVDQTLPNLSDPSTGSSASSSRQPFSSLGASSPEAPRGPPPLISLPKLYEVLGGCTSAIVSMLIRDGVYEANLLEDWLDQQESMIDAQQSRRRYMMQIKSWRRRWLLMKPYEAQTRQQIISDVRRWMSTHRIAIPDDLDGSDTEDEPIPEPGLSQFLADDDFPDFTAMQSPVNLTDTPEDSLL